MDPIVLIIIGVIALIVVIAFIALAARTGNRKKLTEAAELRRDAREREQELDRQHSVAREQEHRAGVAEQEAKAKAAESERLRAEADQHRSALADQERDVQRMEQTAEKLDPRHRADEVDRAGRGPGVGAPGGSGTAAPGTAAPGTAAPGTAAPGTAAPGTAAPGTAAPGTAATGAGGGLTGPSTAGAGGPEVVDPAAVEDPGGRHAAGADVGEQRGREPGIADKLLGRDHPDEPRR